MEADKAFLLGCVVLGSCLVGAAFVAALITVLIYFCHKLYRDRSMKEAFYLLVFTPHNKPDSDPVVRIMSESEFTAFDTKKVFVKFQLRNCDVNFLKRTANDQGWTQTNY